jgi:hypothetical protein
MTLYNPLSSLIRATCPAHLILLDFITHTILKTLRYWKVFWTVQVYIFFLISIECCILAYVFALID